MLGPDLPLTLRNQRLRLGLTIDQVASRLGMSRMAAYRLERELPIRPLPDERIARLAEALQIDVHELRRIAGADSGATVDLPGELTKPKANEVAR